MIRIEFDARALVRKFRTAGERISRGSARALDAEAEVTKERIQKSVYWKNRTQRTRDATRLLRLATMYRRVEVQVPWSTILDKGTKKKNYVIAAKKTALGPMRVGGSGGKFFRRVRHPGLKGFDFVRKEHERARRALLRRVQTVIRNAFKLAEALP